MRSTALPVTFFALKSKTSTMNPYLFLCLVLPTVAVKSDNMTSTTTANQTFSHTTSMSTTKNPPPMHTNNTPTAANYNPSPSKPTPTITRGEATAYSKTTCGQHCTSVNTSPSTNSTTKQKVGTWVVILIILICISIVLFALFRWYSRNPEQRSLRGLRTSVVESVRLAWASAATQIRRPQKQPGDEEAPEAVVAVGGGGEGVEKDVEGEKDRLRGTEDEEEDDSSDDDDSSMESGNAVESARKEGEERRKMEEEDHREGEEMSPILLGDESSETEDEEDVTPL
ncbi:uncharacterized protein LOC143521878 [Brachyhypopomus gauderio]|uniref:uncharacterized protein LOC143521878 n=1 Tax=Brachyhypopomus gauderio TaxID=698409 RepID=UPI004041C5DB